MPLCEGTPVGTHASQAGAEKEPCVPCVPWTSLKSDRQPNTIIKSNCALMQSLSHRDSQSSVTNGLIYLQSASVRHLQERGDQTHINNVEISVKPDYFVIPKSWVRWSGGHPVKYR